MISDAPLPWWKTYFTTHYGRLYQGTFKNELSTEGEGTALGRLFAKARGPVLDVCSGYGRHLRALEDTGVRAYGVDLSAELIAMMPARLRAHVAQGDARRLPFRSGSFSGAYLLFNSFGYFEDEENMDLLREVARVLKPGGAFILDLPARTGMRRVVRELPTSVRTHDGIQVSESWWISGDGKRLEGKGAWEVGGLPKKDWNLSIRLYTPVELARLLRKAGFEGESEIRPLGEFGLLGTGIPSPEAKDSRWRRATNMAVLVHR